MWPLRKTDICVKIYRCHLLYARQYWSALLLLLLLLQLLFWHICIRDVTSSLVWPLPGTIPQFRDHWFKTQGYFTIKHNEKNIYQVQFIWKQTRIKILQEYKYYTECMRAIIWTTDRKTILKRPRMLSTQSVAPYKPCKPKPRLSTHIFVTRPQWVKTEKDNELPISGRFSNQIGILNI